MQTTTNVVPWHPVDNPECSNCHGLARPVRPKKPQPRDCTYDPVQIRLSRKAALRRQFQALVHRAAIPRDNLARCILGMASSTLWRHLKHGEIPEATADQIRSIEYIRREGRKVYVVYDVGDLGPRWESTLRRRQKRAKIASCASEHC